MSQTTLTDRTAKLDNYLQNQMRKTGNQVRLIDLFTCSMKLFAGLLGGLFLLAVIDGWVFELSGWARWLSLVLLLGGGLCYTVLAIVPLLIRKINPVYAAKVVESAQPDMKNSLINYLLLRQQPGKVSRRVVEIVGSKAANDISGVPVENTVDKSHTIRAAMILTALVVTLGAYKVLSPKDPFQTFARIFAPASDITKPARVNITQVSPGNTEVFFGQKLEVSAFITGKFDPANARVVFSTLDGQIVDGSIRMEKQQRNQYACTLKTGDRGIEQSLRYKVVAGDGISNEYVVKMTSSPILTVESILYSPPAYMELEEYTDQGTTTIKHYEGTRITLDALANTDIKSCYLQLLREEGEKLQQVNTVSMKKLDKRRARCSFKLQMNALRDGQRYTHYQLHLVTEDGGRSRPLAANRIIVNPDMAPTISVIDPQETELEVPANSRLRFEVEANDVDFRLSELVVAVENDMRRLVEEKIDIGKQDLGLRVNADYEFWPGKLNSPLRPGDIVYVQFAAFDNREPQTNMTLSNKFKIRIMEPIDNPPKENKSGNPEESDQQQGEGEGDQSEEGQSADAGETGEGGKSADGGDQQGGDQGEESANSQGQEGDSGDAGEGAEGDSGNQSQSGSEEGQEGSESTGEGQSEGQSQGDPSDQGEQGDETGEGGQADSASEQTGGTDTGDPSGQNSGEAGADNSSNGESGGEKSSGDQSADQSADQSGNDPLGDDAHEGEIFEEIMKHREEQQNQAGKGEQNQNQGQTGEQSQQDSAQNGTDPSQPSGSQSSEGEQQGAQSGSQSQQDGSQAPQTGSQSQEGSNQSQEDGDEPQSGGEQGDKQESGESPETDDNGMDQRGESDSQSNNEGQSDQEAGNSGQSDQEQNDQTGQESGQQQSDAGEESQDKQEQSGGGQDQQQDEEKQQQQATGGGNQQETGGGSGQEQSSGSQEGETGESGQQPGASGSQSSGEQEGSEGSEGNESDGANPEQSNSGTGSNSQQPSDSQQNQESSGEQDSDSESPSEQGQQGGSQSGSQDGAQSSPQQNSGQPQDSQSNEGQEQGQQDGNDQSESQGNQQQGSQSGGGDAKQGSQKQQGEGQQSGSGGSSGQQNDGQSSDEQSGGNNPGSGSASENASSRTGGVDSQEDGEGTPADEANLEYSKKATDMALEYLEDQLIDPDPKLLDRIDFTEEELRDFVKRWKELKQQGESGDEQQRREWETTLKSLGLGDGDSTARRYEGQRDDQQGYREDGRTDKPPAGFADRFKAYTKKRNQVKEDQ